MSRSEIAALAPGWRGARRAHTRRYATDEQRSQTERIGRENERVIHPPALRRGRTIERHDVSRPRIPEIPAADGRAIDERPGRIYIQRHGRAAIEEKVDAIFAQLVGPRPGGDVIVQLPVELRPEQHEVVGRAGAIFDLR